MGDCVLFIKLINLCIPFKNGSKVFHDIDQSVASPHLIASANSDKLIRIWDKRLNCEAWGFKIGFCAHCSLFNDHQRVLLSNHSSSPTMAGWLRCAGAPSESTSWLREATMAQ